MYNRFLLFFGLLFISCFTNIVFAQYFYKDIWNNQLLVKEFLILKNENIKTIMVKSFEDDGQPSEGFFCEKRIDKNYTQSEMASNSYISGQSLLVSFYNPKGQITRTVDSTSTSSSVSEYTYDEKGRLKTITNITKADDDLIGGITETRQYFYNANGKPDKMIRKKNNADFSTVNFISDEKGNVTEEQEVLKGNIAKKYFYYYDDKNHLTDVVHYNEIARRLLPDYMFEYNSAGQIKSMVSTEEGTSNYFIWKYTYNDQRLRETETCLSKEKRLLGTISYQYK